MENYAKGEENELEDTAVFQDLLVSGAIHMNVKAGSKIRNLIAFALQKFQDSTNKQIVWGGLGSQAITKVITCAEIIKRKIKNLHQVNDIRFKRIEEYWEPKTGNLERLKVNRDVPRMTILLSKDPLSPSLNGYQGPGIALDRANSSTVHQPGTLTVATEPSLKRKKKSKFRNVKKGSVANPEGQNI